MTKSYDHFSRKLTKICGSPWAFFLAILSVIVWAICGPIFHYSETWQLMINTSTTIITFLMVFVIQQSSNKDTTAMQAKLDEIIRASERARNVMIKAEDRPVDEVEKMRSEAKE